MAKITVGDYLDRLSQSLYIPKNTDEAEVAQISIEKHRYDKEKYKENLRIFAANITKKWLYPKNSLQILDFIDNRFFSRVLTHFCFLLTVNTLEIKPTLRSILDTNLRFIIKDITNQYLSNKKTKRNNYNKLTAIELNRMHDEFINNFWDNMVLQECVSLGHKGLVSLNEKTAPLILETFFLSSFKDFPTIIRPKNWDLGGKNGGYFINQRNLIKANDTLAGRVSYTKRLINIINHLQQWGWSFDIPEQYLVTEFPFDLNKDINDYGEDIQQQLHVLFFLKNFLKSVKIVYYPYNIDFRGRIYALPASFSPISSKKLRTYIRTSKPYGLDDEAKLWVYLQSAHIVGLAQNSYKDTMTVIKEVTEKIENMSESYSKYSAESCLVEIRNGVSSRMFQFDATSSVLQIIGVLLNSKELMLDTNVISNEKSDLTPTSPHIFKDVYSKVLTKAKLNKPFVEMDLLLERKLVKPIVLTYPYGATEYEQVLHLMDHLNKLESQYIRDKGLHLKYNTFRNLDDAVLLQHASSSMKNTYMSKLEGDDPEEIRRYKKRLFCTIFYRHIIKTLYDLYPELEDFKKAFINPNSEYSQGSFSNPYLTFENKYYKTKDYTLYSHSLQYKTKNQSKKRIELKFRKVEEDYDNKKTAAGANYIHSLDAFVLYYIIENKPKECPILTIHDCILIRGCDVKIMLKLAHDAYKEIQKMASTHEFFSKYHAKGSFPITSYNIFKLEYDND